MKAIKTTGILYIEDDEFDPGPHGPLTEEASMAYANALGLDDIEFELAEDD